MKIILQSEARTISNAELAENQKYLISLVDKAYRFIFRLTKKTKENIKA